MSEATQTQSQDNNVYLSLADMLAKPEEELANMNPERDPFIAPRIPEGWYRGTVEYREKDANKRWIRKDGADSDGNAAWWFSTKILCKITADGDGNDSEFKDRTVAPEYLGTVTTKLRKNGASTISGICLHAGLPVAKKTHAGQAETLEKVIQQALQVKFVVRHDLRFQYKDEEGNYHDLGTVQGTTNPKWPKNDDGTPDYAPVALAVFDSENGWKLAETQEDVDKAGGNTVQVTGRVDTVVDRFSGIVKK